MVQAVCSVLILQASALAKLVIKGTNVKLPVDVTTLVQSVQHVIRPQVNALAKLDTPEELVILVPPTTTEQVMELVQVSITLWKYVLHSFSDFSSVLIFSLWLRFQWFKQFAVC